jgi:hypothetical protein
MIKRNKNMMRSFKYIILYSFLFFISISTFTSCGEDDLDESTFGKIKVERNEFDSWLLDNYIKPYNIDLKYRFEDIESDMSYNLVPAELEKSKEMAKLIKHLWLGAYDEVCGEIFMKQYGPRIINLIGSSAVNPDSKTEVLGTADKGIKVTLYKINSLDKTNIELLNLYYFRTMHHEFAHILHQTKNYPTEFNEISVNNYSPTGWMNRTNEQAHRMGFVSNYASSEAREDFVEVIANFLTRTDAAWNEILRQATFTDEEAKEELPDKQAIGTGNGKVIILSKLKIAREWLKSAWNIDIDKLRTVIAKRSTEIDSL